MNKICLIGHPNCGKSTIFNKLTKSNSNTGNRHGVTVEVAKAKYGKNSVCDLPGLHSIISSPASDDHKISRDFIAQKDYDIIINVIDITNISNELPLTLELINLKKPIIIILNKADQKVRCGIEVDVKKLSKILNVPIIETIANRGFGLENIKNLLKPPHHMPQIEDLSVEEALSSVSEIQSSHADITDTLDKFILHKNLGPLIFLGIMFCIFFLSINIGNLIGIPLQNGSDLFFNTFLASKLPQYTHPVLIEGLGGAITLILQFIPIIAILYLLIGILEESGYMPRAACVMDRLMKKIGLSGKSFIPLIIGFGCNVPAILTLRTLECKSEKIATAMMVPFMSCGARLTVYTVLGTAFFKNYTSLVVFGLYLLGMVVAVISGYLIKTLIAKPQGMCFLINIPKYQHPRVSALLSTSYYHAKEFTFRAGKLIATIFILVAILQNYFTSENYIERVSKSITPYFEPIGISTENWPAATGLLTGIVAKELVVASIISSQKSMTSEESKYFGFKSTHALLAYLVFILLYFPCISTFAVMAKELSYRWATVSVAWSMTTAYLVALAVFIIGESLV